MKFDKELVIKQTDEHKEDIAFMVKHVNQLMLKRAKEHDYSKYEKPELLAHALNERQKGNKQPMKEWMNFHNKEDHNEGHFKSLHDMNLFQCLELSIDGACAVFRRQDYSIKTKEDQEAYYMRHGFDKMIASIMANTFMYVLNYLKENK